MQSESGKTFRFIDYKSERDTSLRVSTPIEIFGYKLSPSVSYSMKKKGRWQIPKLLSTQYDNEDKPIIYSKQQCIYDEIPILDRYLYDSLTDTRMGSLDVSNQRLEKGRFNMNSVIHQIENKQRYTEKERKLYVKLNRQRKNKENKSRRPFTLQENQKSLEEKHESEVKLRYECVYLREYIHLQDYSRVNLITNHYHGSCYNYGATKRTLNKYDLDYESSEEEIETVEIVEEEKRKPFVLTENDFHCQDKRNHNRRKQKKKKLKNETIITHKDNEEDEERSKMCREDKIEEGEILSVVLELSKNVFVEEIKTIRIFCKCWESKSKPWTLLIDVDQFDESESKCFLLIKPTVEKNEDLICVKMLFNFDDTSLQKEDVLKSQFTSIIEVVSFIQSRLRPHSVQRTSSSRKMVIADEFIHGSNLQKVKKVDNPNSLFWCHKEWKSCDSVSDNIEASMSTNMDYSLEECDICGSVSPDDELTQLSECNHRICDGCLSNYILSQLNHDMDEMICPRQGCFTFLKAPTILSLVPWRLYKRRLNILESVIIKMAGKPCYDCGAVLINDEFSKDPTKEMEYLCECGRFICYNCGQLQHWPSSCQEMRDHNLKIVQFKEKENVAKPSSSYSNIYCSNCNNWVCNLPSMTLFECICLKPFCEKCRFKYESHVDSCKISAENKLTFPYSTEVIPFQKPKSVKLKLYNQSIYLGFLQHPNNTNELKEDLCRIMSTTTVCQFGFQHTKELTNLYLQILRILESMFVAAYNFHRRNDPKKYLLLKVSTTHLLFYVRRIHRLKEEIHKLMKEKRSKIVETAILNTFTSLENDINTSKVYIDKVISLLKI